MNRAHVRKLTGLFQGSEMSDIFLSQTTWARGALIHFAERLHSNPSRTPMPALDNCLSQILIAIRKTDRAPLGQIHHSLDQFTQGYSFVSIVVQVFESGYRSQSFQDG